MNIDKDFFYNNKSQRLSAKIYSQPPVSEKGVIYCHGMFSSKDGYKITRMAEDIVNAGFTLLTFDFSFAGESEGNISELSILQEADDLNSACSYFEKYGIKNIHLIGSSLGGLVTLLFSSVMGEKISSQTLLATPVILNELMQSMAGKDYTSLPLDGATTVEGVPVNNRFFHEAETIDMENALAKNKVPSLIIHGGKDVVVPVSNALVLIRSLNCEKRIVLIEDGDHNLSRDPDINILLKNILEWIKSH